MTDRPEARLLLLILVERWEEAARLAGVRAFSAATFVELCRLCDVHPQVHARLVAAGRGDLVGGAAMERLAALRDKTRNDNLLLLSRLEQMLDLLGRERIVPVALKGVDVLHRLYGSFDERTLDDIDLFVRPRDRDRALAAAEAAGWSAPQGAERIHWLRSSYEMPLTSPGRVTVSCEIHWSLAQDVRYAIDADAVVDRARPLTIEGREVLRLDDHDAVAHLLLHHVQHYFDRRLKWVLDLGSLARQPGFSWETVAERLRSWGGVGAAGLALAHVRELFPELLDPRAYRLIPARTWRLAATLPLRSRHPLEFYRGTRLRFVQLWIAAAALERPEDVPRYLRHRVTRDRRADRGSAPPTG